MSAEKKQPRKRGNAAEATGQQSVSPTTTASVPTVADENKGVALIREFEGHPLTVLWREGKPYWIAREVGAAMGYEDGSKLVDLIGDEWADEFIEGTDFVRVSGAAAAEILRAVGANDSGENAETTNPRNSGNGRGARRVLLLSESGVNLAAIKTRKPAGKRLRRWLASEVLPSIARGTALSSATQEQISRAVRVEMDRQFRTPESKHAELMRCAGNTGEAFARILGCDAGQARAAAIELAKGLVGYGGTGRELGYVTTRQFKAMRALLQGLPSFVALAPRKRRRQLVRVIESGDGGSVQQVLPIFRAQADVGNAVVTVTVEKKPEAA